MTESDSQRTSSTELLLILVAVIWAANYPLSKYGLSGLDIFIFNSIRFVVAALLLVLLFVARFSWKPVTRSDWPKLIGAGVVANVVYQVVFITGLNMTTAGNTAVLLSTSPLWTMFLNARIHKEKMAGSMWVGMFVSLCGVVMIIVGSGKKLEFGSHALYGDIICLAAAALWGLNTNLQKPLLNRYSPMQLTLVMIAVGALGLSLISVPSAIALTWGSISWTYYLVAIASGALSIGVASVFWSRGVKVLGPGRTANFNNLVPVLAFIISYVTLHEQLFPIHFAGAAVTITGVWYARR